jgi:hypothetical protein
MSVNQILLCHRRTDLKLCTNPIKARRHDRFTPKVGNGSSEPRASSPKLIARGSGTPANESRRQILQSL